MMFGMRVEERLSSADTELFGTSASQQTIIAHLDFIQSSQSFVEPDGKEQNVAMMPV